MFRVRRSVLLKGRIPDQEIDGWVTLPSSSAVPDAARRARIPVKHVSVSPDKLIFRVHPKFSPKNAEKKSLKELKEQTFTLDGERLEKHRRIAGMVAENTKDLAKKEQAERRRDALGAGEASPSSEPYSPSPSPEPHVTLGSILRAINDSVDNTGGHAHELDEKGWSAADISLGGYLADTPEEAWTPADYAAAYHLANKYRRQHGYDMSQFAKPEVEGGRRAKSISMAPDGKIVFDYPFNRGINDDLKRMGARFSPRHGKKWVLDPEQADLAALKELDGFTLTSGRIKGKLVGAIKEHFSDGHFKLLTATPVPNDPMEMYRLMQLVDPDALGPQKPFEDRHVVRKVVNGRKVVAGYKNLDDLAQKISPYFIRRKVKDPEVGIHLPPKIMSRPRLGMDPKQQRMYDDVRKGILKNLGSEGIDVDALDDSDKTEQSNILAQLTRLRQISLSPELVDRSYTGGSPKIEHAAHAIRTHLANSDKGIVVFSEFNEAFPILQRHLLAGDTGGDGKFSESDFAEIHGGISTDQRDRAKAQFNAGRKRVLFVNTKAGGAGLNLQQGGSAVYHLAPTWNPAVMDQATARVHRPGQQDKTTVFIPEHENGIDEKMRNLIVRKRAMSEQLLGDAARAGKRQFKTMKVQSISADELRSALGGKA